MPLRLGQFAQSIISRRMRHTHEIDKAPATEQPSSSAAPLIFESLEPRLLLAADPLGISAGYAFSEFSGTTTADASGHGLTRHTRKRSHLHDGREVRQCSGPGWRQRLCEPWQSHGPAIDRQHDGQCLDLLERVPGRRCGDRIQADGEARSASSSTPPSTRHAHDRVQADQQLRRTDVPLRRNDPAGQHLVLRHRGLQCRGPDPARLSQRSARQRRTAGHRHDFAAEFDGQRQHRPASGSPGIEFQRPHRRRADRQSRVDAGSDPNRYGDAACGRR